MPLTQHLNPTHFRAASWLASLLLLSPPALLAQPTLRITSPPDGTLVHPGQSIKVTVETSGTFQQMMIVGWSPIGFSMLRSAPPWEFTIQIPNNIRPGKSLLPADGSTEPGTSFTSSIRIFVELADEPARLNISPPIFELYLGGKDYLPVDGVLPDGHSVGLNQSKEISFKSSEPDVATVNEWGQVTPAAPGSAKIIVTYHKLTAEVPITVLARHP